MLLNSLPISSRRSYRALCQVPSSAHRSHKSRAASTYFTLLLFAYPSNRLKDTGHKFIICCCCCCRVRGRVRGRRSDKRDIRLRFLFPKGIIIRIADRKQKAKE